MTFRELDEGEAPVTVHSGTAANQPNVRVRPKPRTDGRPKIKAEREPSAVEMEDDAAAPVTLEETPALSEEALRPGASSGEDHVRLYLKEIGKVRLLPAQQEVSLGQRIEAGQIQLRRALGGIPLATARLLALADLVRRGELELDEVILLPDGVEPRPDEVKPLDRKSTRLNSSHGSISYAVFCLKKKKKIDRSHVVENTKKKTKYYH